MKGRMVLIFFVLAGLISVKAYPDDDDWKESKERRKITGPIVVNAKFKAECGSCHMAYPPGLLPSYSWEKMMNNLGDHFGDDASLDENTKMEVARYLIANSSDRLPNRRGKKILASMENEGAFLRVSETGYFKRKHRKIGDSVYKRKAIGLKSNCLACHQGAESGEFDDDQIRIPKENELPAKKEKGK